MHFFQAFRRQVIVGFLLYHSYRYRKLIPKTGPIFGVTMVANRPAIIRVGDPVYATKVDKIDVGPVPLEH